MSMPALERSVQPEWLDEMSADDPRAARSRRDLRVLNGLMGHPGIVRRALRRRLNCDRPRIADLGAGDGTFLISVLRRDAHDGGEIVLVDRRAAVTASTVRRYEAVGYAVRVSSQDVFEWLRDAERCDVIVANLFLHHFDEAELRHLLVLVASRSRLFVACEPRRALLPLAMSHLLGVIGANGVTRHDAVLSVRAGFAEKQLSDLWPAHADWQLAERPAGLFSHLFIAQRRER